MNDKDNRRFMVAEVQEGGADFFDFDLRTLKIYILGQHTEGLDPEALGLGDFAAYGNATCSA